MNTNRGTLLGTRNSPKSPPYGMRPTTHRTTKRSLYHLAPAFVTYFANFRKPFSRNTTTRGGYLFETGNAFANVLDSAKRLGIQQGAGHISEVERSLMVRWVVGSILHGVDPLSYFSFQPVLHDWCNKCRGMCHPVCGMVHIKEPLLLIDKSSLCGGSGFPFSLSEWSLTICLTPYNRR